MNYEHLHKSLTDNSHAIAEKSFVSFNSSRTSLINQANHKNQKIMTPLSHRRQSSNNPLKNENFDDLITATELSLNYFKEFDQPGNQPIKSELKKLYNLNKEAKILNREYERLKR